MLTLGLAQINSVVGDPGNLDLIKAYTKEAREKGVEILLFPELAICGYPPEDLLLREDFFFRFEEVMQEVAQVAQDIVLVCGFPELYGRDPYNSLAVCAEGEIKAVYRKMHLPNYGVFDERRYFRAGDQPALIRVNDRLIGLTICEDIWLPGPPMSEEALAGAELILNISASPYFRGKGLRRETMLAQRAKDNLCAIAYCNLVGGQDELIFDGQSLVIDAQGNTLARAPQYEEHLLVTELDLDRGRSLRLHDARYRTLQPERDVPILADIHIKTSQPQVSEPSIHLPLEEPAEVYSALVTGVRDYVQKNGFKSVLLGLSGGIDSTLVAMVAADALGAENVTGIVMPSPYSSNDTQSDAHIFGTRLGINVKEIKIRPMMESYDEALRDEFEGTEIGVTEENIQARIRGNLLMAMSNKFGSLLLTTGNKSEMSVGYATLYGDMAGGFAVIKDVPKLLVFALTAWRNRRFEEETGTTVCPWSIIERPPSAELRPDQQDTDSLPPYEVLDPILEAYVENDASIEEITASGFDKTTVERIIRMVDLAEYKRRQAPPGIKITPRAFGRDRRMPLTNRYRAEGRQVINPAARPQDELHTTEVAAEEDNT